MPPKPTCFQKLFALCNTHNISIEEMFPFITLKVFTVFSSQLTLEPHASKREREDAMRECLQNNSFSRAACLNTQKFIRQWKAFHFRHQNLSVEDIETFKKACKTIRRFKLRVQNSARGFNSHGGLKKELKGSMKLQGETPKLLPNPSMPDIPLLEVKKIKEGTLKDLQLLTELVDYRENATMLKLRGEKEKKCKKKQAYGVSLGRTISTTRGNKKEGRIGTIMMNSTLNNPQNRKKKLPRTHPQLPSITTRGDLQEFALRVVTDAIVEAFGKSYWFKAAMDALRDIPKDRLLPGLPCSNIWLTRDPSIRQVHVDTNTVQPAFLLSPFDCTGGETLVQNPRDLSQPYKIELLPGKVIGGCWAQLPHCTEKVLDTRGRKSRYSFVVYLDHRIFNFKYVAEPNPVCCFIED